METRANHVLIGAFTVAVTVLTLLFVLWLGKSALDQEWDYYDIVFKEAVTGLTVGGAVQYNGIQVGEVRRLALDPKDPRRAIAHVRVSGGTPIKADTKAKLAFTGLTGVAIIQLSGGTPQSPELVVGPGQRFPTIVADESAIQKILNSSEDIITSVNDIMLRLSRLLNQENVDKIAASLDHIEKVTGALAQRSGDIGTAVDDIAAASRMLRETLEGTDKLMQRLDSIATNTDRLVGEDLKPLLASARESLEAARKLAESGGAMVEENREAISGFSQQGLAQVGPAIAELRAVLRELKRVTAQLDDNPTDYLLGRDKPKEYERK